ncbi:MAG: bifunctional phosphopantothenoylcysteine decarboxylase/phosphopantothenate--cysteine ligase CoaBC [Terriglobales bacterium]
MKIVLGVTGGIAAYKAAEILRLLQDRGLEVQVVMTRAAQEFVRPLTFAALSGQKVITDMFAGHEPNVDSAVEHISVAESIDALLVAPATADTLAKFAHGLADDFLSTLYLATKAPVIVAPAMNVNMWENPATRENLETLRARGVRVVEPGSGYLACGMVGAGRLAENETIVEAVLQTVQKKHDLAGETILITAGPTREPIDPVRFISNRSSGKMGYALAEVAAGRGAKVILVSGPTALNPPSGVEVIPVETADEMLKAVMARFADATIVIKAAAVADFRPKHAAAQKLKGKKEFALELAPNRDIVAELASRRRDQVLIGFAAETDNVLENARKKLVDKKLDAIVANDVSQPGIGMDSDRNAVTILTHSEVIEVPEASKRAVAGRILDVARQLRATIKNEDLRIKNTSA